MTIPQRRPMLSFAAYWIAAMLLGDWVPTGHGFLSSVKQNIGTSMYSTLPYPSSERRWSRWNQHHFSKTEMLMVTAADIAVEEYGDIATKTSDDATVDGDKRMIGRIVFLVPSDSERKAKFGIHSPVGSPSYLEAARHLSSKAWWFSEGQVETTIVTMNDVIGGDSGTISTLHDANILIVMGLQSADEVGLVEEIFQKRREESYDKRFSKCHFALDCSLDLPAMVGPYDDGGNARWKPSLLLPWSATSSGKRFCEQMYGLFHRWTSDDFTVAMMLFLNRFSGRTVDWVKDSADATWEKGPLRNAKEFYGMATKCGDCLADCLKDEKCKACLQALTELDTRDQAASYRAIVSYESEELKNFSLCTFQKHNIFQCQATIPTIPKVTPMATWRGEPLTQKVARSLLVGHLDEDAAPKGSKRSNVSWKVACGANVAYDQFPSQNQLFYEAAKGKDMWYDPVFRVETLDGRHVWCKRHYRVRDGPAVGTFLLSVLDNGVTSSEFWTIVGAADDLSWIAFHYAGAAKTVGQRYLGGLLCTVEGNLPNTDDPSKNEEVWKLFRTAGIEAWELFIVNNDPKSAGSIAAGPPPLDFYRKDVLASKELLMQTVESNR